MTAESARRAPEPPDGGGGEAEDLLRTLRQETRRCLRYNHFCSLILVSCRADRPAGVYDRIRGRLRDTDHVELLRGRAAAQTEEAEERCSIAAVLPETSAEGAKVALRRVLTLLPDLEEVRSGVAVYPDDETDPRGLLRVASALAA